MRNRYHKKSLQAGFTLIEMMVYLSIVVVLTGIAVGSLLFLNARLYELSISRTIDDTAQTVMEKLVREIRFAHDVNTLESVFGITPGKLALLSSEVDETPTTIEFSVATGTLEFYRNGALLGPLTPNNISIDEIIFDHITTPRSEAIKISLLFSGARGAVQLEESFSTTVVLRGSY